MSRETSTRLSRRALLAGLGLGAVSAGALARPSLGLARGTAAKGDRWDRRPGSLSAASMSEWKRQVGSEFALVGAGNTKLVEVTPLRSLGRRPDGLREGAFMAVFESTGAALPPGDRMMDVSHSSAGAMKIYFSACGDRCGGRRLQAVFN